MLSPMCYKLPGRLNNELISSKGTVISPITLHIVFDFPYEIYPIFGCLSSANVQRTTHDLTN